MIRNDEAKIAFSLGGKKPLCESKSTFSVFCTPTNLLNTKSSPNFNEMAIHASTSSSGQKSMRDNKGISSIIAFYLMIILLDHCLF